MTYSHQRSGGDWYASMGIHAPTRDEYVRIVQTAASGTRLRPAVKRKLTLYAKRTSSAVYGRDYWGGSSCPLAAVGIKRNQRDAWQEDGAYDFECAYDLAMSRLVHLRGPCRIGVKA